MQVFNVKGVTSLLPRLDGTCLVAQGALIGTLDPSKSDVNPYFDAATNPLVHQMSFVPDKDNPERYLQARAKGGWSQGFDTTTKTWYPYASPRNGTMRCRWSTKRGRVVGVNDKGRLWCTDGPLAFSGTGGTRRRATDMPAAYPDNYVVINWFPVVLPDRRFVYEVALVWIWSSPPRPELWYRTFDLVRGKFTGDLSVASAGPLYRNQFTCAAETASGSVVFYDASSTPQAMEIGPTTPIPQKPPEWYPDFADTIEYGNPLPLAIGKDRSAWVTNGGRVSYRTAEDPSRTRTFKPNGRRKVRGCAFAADGQTLWFFDSANIYRVDVD